MLAMNIGVYERFATDSKTGRLKTGDIESIIIEDSDVGFITTFPLAERQLATKLYAFLEGLNGDELEIIKQKFSPIIPKIPKSLGLPAKYRMHKRG